MRRFTRRQGIRVAIMSLTTGALLTLAPFASRLYAAEEPLACCGVDCLFGKCGAYCPVGTTPNCRCEYGMANCDCD